ncbi:hypothetical protein A3D80_04025 [Candidatus Roizmanbacteria bacterium RIFCSPHIGHO2_02_FULL_40_13b]|uniref:Reverse transcriptase domain-containing protein n=1 Tax=Candidatus Roizmanbacteria bacterium RIFCSPHIGHO2_01_FULL_39_24 TaxID=1802032 RepID=A0A1F7GK27_9BACT|nr:MAG: hypothetical protein A2799_03560 [Candidatus Roizmanbacteria bacterium RIFCSPHIGHO2_01_FULL_39_24]OGK27960.1 MAG: hypothetical protein A3D80_04025 [Candidatus Roizmanbacteria bacterium RIFCSPHIGHO2_02_FULL_40_13b]
MDYNTLVSLDSVFRAWGEFRKGKGGKKDVQLFERYLEDNLFALYQDLVTKKYRHGSYESFYVNDPKRRHIHKASVQDRVVHHLLYTYLYQLFDKIFITDSYSCRLNKGTHKAVSRLEVFTRKVSKNYTQDCWALHLDINKFFASVDHEILKKLLAKKIQDENSIRLLSEVIDSFEVNWDPIPTAFGLRSRMTRNVSFWSPVAGGTIESPRGIPLGNLTSQVFANIYMNELDQYVKHGLKIHHYIRYADDFVILFKNQSRISQVIEQIRDFLSNHLKLSLHENKIIIRRLEWGIDFLGYIVLPHYRLPRTKTKRRVFSKLKEKIDTKTFDQSLQSYIGYLSHANTYRLSKELQNNVWFWS